MDDFDEPLIGTGTLGREVESKVRRREQVAHSLWPLQNHQCLWVAEELFGLKCCELFGDRESVRVYVHEFCKTSKVDRI